MKTRYTRMMRLSPILGILLVAAAAVNWATYRNLQRKIQACEAQTATVDRLYHDQTVTAVLKRLQEGDVTGAAQRLDEMLCQDILQLNSQMASAGKEQRDYTQHLFAQIGRVRPSNAVIGAGTTRGLYDEQLAAEKLLAAAAAQNAPVNNHVAASP